MIYSLTAIGLTLGGSGTVQYSTLHYTTLHCTTLHYTSTHKQYIEQHTEKEYPEQNIHNNKNT